MAKEKQKRRMIAMALAAAVTMSSVPVVAFAEEVTDPAPSATTETKTTVSSDGTKTETTTTTQPTEGTGTQDSPAVEKSQVVVTITPSGADTPSSTETTDTTDTSWSETTEDSSTTFEEHKEDKVTVENDENGEVVTTTENTVEGEQTTVTEENANNDTTQPDVTVEMIPGETTTGYGKTEVKVTGPDKDKSDSNWDLTETQTVTREVTVETGKISTQETPVSDIYMEGLGPDVAKGNPATDWNEAYDYNLQDVYKNTDSKIKIVHVVYEKNADGTLAKDENGNYITKSLEEVGNQPASLIMLQDKEGNRVFAYCVDEDTSTRTGYKYVVENLEDATYFKYDDAKDNLRAIALNGYWGEPNYVQNGDGTQEKNLSAGSMAYAKENMNKAIDEGKLNFSYGGVEYSSKTEEGKAVLKAMVDSLNDDELMAATQAAIWSCANGHMAALHGGDGEAVSHITGTDDADIARKMTFYHYLLSLPAEEKQETTVIDQDSFLSEDGLSITIGEQVVGHTNNTDDDDDNDVYSTDISFKMVVTPGENDDMIVTLVDGNNNLIREARIAGKNAEGQNYEVLTADEEGKYTFKDLQLQENSDTTFDLRLEGMQHLEQGVYIYKYHTGNYEDAQTLISVGEGTRDFNVHTTFNVTFDVDENDRTVVKRSWRSHEIRTTDNEGGDNNTTDPEEPKDSKDPKDPKDPGDPEHFEDIGDNDVPLAGIDPEEPVDIGDEEVPLAAADEEVSVVAETGDNNHMTGAFGGMFAALAGMFMLRRKKED